MTKRVCELKIDDIFVKYGKRQAIIRKVGRYFIYQSVNDIDKIIGGAVQGKLGINSQEKVEVCGKLNRTRTSNLDLAARKAGIDL